MGRRYKEGILPFKIVPCNEPLVARSGPILPYEMAKALRLPELIDEELPGPGSGHGYKPSKFVMPLILMFHGGGKKLEDLREIKGEMSLRELLEMESLPASCTIGDWLKEFEKILGIAPGNLEARVWIQKARTGGAAPAIEVAAEEVGKPKPCVWMKMGAVSYRMCTKDYDCLTCEFDQQMQTAGESPEIAAALEKLKRLPGNQRLCRYALREEISYRLCTRLFECVNCEFYQLMEEAMERKLAKLSARREALRKKQTKT